VPDAGVLVIALLYQVNDTPDYLVAGFKNPGAVQCKTEVAFEKYAASVDTVVLVDEGDSDWLRALRQNGYSITTLAPSGGTVVKLVQQRSRHAEMLEVYLRYVAQLWDEEGLLPHHIGDVRAPGSLLEPAQRRALNQSPWLKGNYADARTGDLLIPPHLTRRREQSEQTEAANGQVEGKRRQHPGSVEELESEQRERTEPAEWVLIRQPRLLIVGEAGLGKTTALRLLAARSARLGLSQLRDRSRPLDKLEVLVLTTVKRFQDHKSLHAALRHDLVSLAAVVWPEYPGDRLEVLMRSRTTLLLDSVDEAGSDAQALLGRIRHELQSSDGQPVFARVVLTTRAETEPHLLEALGWSEADRWEMAPCEWLGWTGFIHRWFGPESPKAKALVQTLATGLLQAHQNPLLLTLAVQAHDQEDLTPDTTPAELYDRCVKQLLEGRWRPLPTEPTLADVPRYREERRQEREECLRDGDKASADECAEMIALDELTLLKKMQREAKRVDPGGSTRRSKLALARNEALLILPAIAWKLFGADVSGRTFDETRFLELAGGQRHRDYEPEYLLAVLKQGGLVEASGDGVLIWPHRSFVAYFAAKHVATLLEDPKGRGFDSKVTLDLSREPYVREVTGESNPQWTGPISDLLRIVRWMPVWEPFLQFLAGHLTQPATVNKLLGHITACSLTPSKSAVELTFKLLLKPIVRCIRLIAFVRSAVRLADISMVHEVEGVLSDAVAFPQLPLWEIGSAMAAYPEKIQAMVEVARDAQAERMARYSAFLGLKLVGPVLAARPEVMKALIEVATDTQAEGTIRERAIQVLEALGPVLATCPGAMQALIEIVKDARAEAPTRKSAIITVKSLGPALAACQEVAQALIEVASDGQADAEVREVAIEKLLSLNPIVVACPEAVQALIAVVKDAQAKGSVRTCAVRELKSLGPALVACPGAIQVLGEVLKGVQADHSRQTDGAIRVVCNSDYRWATMEALESLGPALAGSREAPQALLALAKEVHWEEMLSNDTMHALASFGPILGACPEAMRALLAVAKNPREQGWRRSRALRAVTEADPSLVARPEGIQATIEVVKDAQAETWLRVDAIWELESLLPTLTDCNPAMQALLAVAKEVKVEAWLRENAIWAFESFGPALAAYPEGVKALLAIANEDQAELGLRRSAISALGSLGPTLTEHPEVIRALIELTNEPRNNKWLGTQAIEVLGSLGPAVAAFPGATQALIGVATDESLISYFCQHRAILVLGSLGPVLATCPGVIQALIEVAKDTQADVTIRANAIWLMGRLGPVLATCPDVIQALIRFATDVEYKELNFEATQAIRGLGPALAECPEAIQTLIRLSKDPIDHASLCGRSARSMEATHALRELGPALAIHPESARTLLISEHDDGLQWWSFWMSKRASEHRPKLIRWFDSLYRALSRLIRRVWQAPPQASR
jgi:hypothetical protein